MGAQVKNRKILIAGSLGQLGFELLKSKPGGTECLGADLPETDITNREQVLGICREYKPDLIINAAAYTAVDKAETDVELAAAVNIGGAANLAGAAESTGAKMIHISTDFVFDGSSGRPRREDDPTGPLGVYGRTKLEGEKAVLKESPGAVIIRTSWLYSSHGANFVKTMLRLMADGKTLKVVSDQVGSPTWAGGLAMAVWKAAGSGAMEGIYHWSDCGVASWYDFAVAIQEEALGLGLLKNPGEILPVPGEEYPTLAERPAYSVMDTSKIRDELGLPGVHWRKQLRMMMKELD